MGEYTQGHHSRRMVHRLVLGGITSLFLFNDALAGQIRRTPPIRRVPRDVRVKNLRQALASRRADEVAAFIARSPADLREADAGQRAALLDRLTRVGRGRAGIKSKYIQLKPVERAEYERAALLLLQDLNAQERTDVICKFGRRRARRYGRVLTDRRLSKMVRSSLQGKCRR